MDGCAWPVRPHCPRRLKQVLDLCSRRGKPRPASEDAVLYKTTGSRNLPEHQTQIRRCSQGRSIRQNVPQGILDGLRLICITTMAVCGLCSTLNLCRTRFRIGLLLRNVQISGTMELYFFVGYFVGFAGFFSEIL